MTAVSTPLRARWRPALVAGLFLVTGATAQDPSPKAVAAVETADPAGARAHASLLASSGFPSARECGECHQRQYREWSVSPHAYAQMSPTYTAYQALLVKLTQGSLGDFCVRCHTEVGMTLGEPIIASNRDRAPISVEGITCVTCHRVSVPLGKNVGRFPLEPGDLTAPIWGPHDGAELARVLANPDTYKRVVTDSAQPGRRVHREARELPQITRPAFCGRCHDVRLVDGMRLEDAFSEYKQSAAAGRGETCQDCHMGPVPGIASAYPDAPAAVIGEVPTAPTRRTNHMFAGPDVPVVHPGLFPHNPAAAELATPEEWRLFDWQAGWGTDTFEDGEPEDGEFPERWASVDDRYDGRRILDDQLALRLEARERGTTLLRRGYGLGEIVDRRPAKGLSFEVDVFNATDGHSVPTGLIVERMVFLQVEVLDGAGAVVFRSGDLDPDGDARDLHSEWVRQGLLPLDEQLFNLRSPYVVHNLAGSEREQILPANYSFDPLVFVRPSPTPSLLMGGVASVRLHKRNIEPEGRRTARFQVPAAALAGRPGPFAVTVRLVSGPLPVHLLRTIGSVGWEWGLSTRDVAEGILSGYRILWERRARLSDG